MGLYVSILSTFLGYQVRIFKFDSKTYYYYYKSSSLVQHYTNII